MRAIIAAIALAASAWAQEQKPASPQEEIRKIQAFLVSTDGGTREDFKARHDAQFEKLEALVSAYLMAQMDAAPDIKAEDLRAHLAELLQTKGNADLDLPSSPGDSPLVLRRDPLFGQTGASVFSIMYSGEAWFGLGGGRVVVESYVLESGKTRLAGRLGREMDGVVGGAKEVGTDELLVQGLVTWTLGANLPHKAALYRMSESGVSLAWESGPLRGMEATVFGQYLLVNYVDPNPPVNAFTWALDVYSLDNGVPSLVFRREH